MDGVEPMTFYTDKHPTARKSHFCQMCRRTIRPGEKYRRSAGMDGSSAWTWIECAHCEAFVTVAYRRSWMDEGYDEDLLRDFEPQDVGEARVRAQFRRRWQDRAGDLYAVPEIQWTEDKYGFGHPTAIRPGR
jgi:RNase P subunit RPR2